MLKGKYLWIILLLILIISLVVYFIYREKENNNLLTEEKIEEIEDFVEVEEAPVKIEQGIVLGIKDGQKEWEIKADKISLGKDRKDTIFEEIKNIIIYKNDNPHLKIEAEKCIADMSTKSMKLLGDVVIETEEGDILKGMGFFWDSNGEKLSSTAPVEILVKDYIISAERFFSDTELNNLQLEGNASVILKLNSSK